MPCLRSFFSALETNGAIFLNSSIEVLFNFKSRRIPISTSALSAKLLLPSHVSSSGRCLCVLHLGSPANPPAPFSVPDSNRWIISARTNANPTAYLLAAAALPNGDTQKVETAKAESSGCDDSTRCRSAEVQTRRDETKRARLLLLSLDVKSLVCAEPLPFTLQGLIRIRCKLFFPFLQIQFSLPAPCQLTRLDVGSIDPTIWTELARRIPGARSRSPGRARARLSPRALSVQDRAVGLLRWLPSRSQLHSPLDVRV